MRVLAFEDSYDIESLLREAGVNFSDVEFHQHWNTKDCFERIQEFKPDVLLLDHYIPPIKGLEVLKGLLNLVASGQLTRPENIIGISSSESANQDLMYAGADEVIVKFRLPELEVWKK
jgi:CheY-like chemotaxis protein